MRKLVVLLLVAMLSCAFVAHANESSEIEFRNVPWCSTPSEVAELLSDFFMTEPIVDGALSSWEGHVPYSMETAHLDAGVVCYGAPYEGIFSVAGYDCYGFELDFIYPVEDGTVVNDSSLAQFYMASYILDIADVESAYEDLREKLTSLYGEGVEELGDKDSIIWAGYEDKAIAWHGANDTGVILLCRKWNDSELLSDSISIVYGKTNSGQLLDEIDELNRLERVRYENENRSDSTDGL